MQLTSAAAAAPAERPASIAVERLDRPAVTAVVAFAAWLAFVVARWATWAGGHVSLFIMSGIQYSHARDMSPRISHVPLAGYDGQFYYRLAMNPFNWSQTAYGITMDHNYRYTRIGYPLVVWIVSLGQPRLVPTMLVLVNLACVAVIGWVGGRFARDAGRHALWGLLLVAYFGLVISVGRDTAEPVADACMLGGLLAYRRQRYLLAGALIGYGVVTNEPVLVVAVAIAATRLYAHYRSPERGPVKFRLGRPDLVWLVPAFAYLVLQVIERTLVHGQAGSVSDVTQNISAPFWAMGRGLFTDFRLMSWTHLGLYDFNLIEFAALACFVVAGCTVLRSTTAPLHERVAFAGFVVIEIVMASWQFWGSVFGDGRTYIDAYLLAIVMLLATPEPVVTAKRLRWLAAVAIAVLIVVGRRRIMFE